MAEGSLAGDGRRKGRSRASGVRRRDGHQHLALPVLRLGSPRGERAHTRVPRNRGKNATLLASMGVEEMGHCLAVEGSITAAVFETYVERVLAPSLRSGRLVVMDNLAAHRGRRIKELIEERGCELVYLPPYSPDLNPIEEAFSKIKRLLRVIEARTRKALIEAMGAAISAVTDRDARGFFEHCGYRIPVQSL